MSDPFTGARKLELRLLEMSKGLSIFTQRSLSLLFDKFMEKLLNSRLMMMMMNCQLN